MTNYPAQIDTAITLPTIVDNLTPVRAAAVNTLRDAILAVEGALGVNPGVGSGTVRARLDSLSGTINNLQVIQLAGDLGNTLSNPYVIGIQGRPVSTVAPNLGDVLVWDGVAWQPASVSSSVEHATATQLGSIQLSGDLNGSGSAATSPRVGGINGAAVPVSGSLVTGNVLQVSGVATLAYGAINLAGGSNYVIGVLPTANQASQTMGGDVTGTTASSSVVALRGKALDVSLASLGASQDGYILTWVNASSDWQAKPESSSSITLLGDVTGPANSNTVSKIHGASVPVAGSLVTGNVLQVSGTSTLSYGAVNLAGGSNYVTGVLPIGNQASQNMAGDVTGTTAASSVVALRGNVLDPSLAFLGSAQDGYVMTWINGSSDWQARPTSSTIVSGQNYQFSNSSSDISGYNQLLDPASGSESDLSISITSGSGIALIEAFATQASSPNVDLIPAGLWEFNFYSYVSNTGGTTQLVFNVYTRTSGGVETLMFSAVSSAINVTSVGSFTLLYNNPFDTYIASGTRIVIKVNAQTNSASAKTIHFVFDGATHASLVRTPISGASLQLGGDLTGTTSAATVIQAQGGKVLFDSVHGKVTAGGTGSDYFATIGPLVGSESTFSALWLLSNGASPTGSNSTINQGAGVLQFATQSSSGSMDFVQSGGGRYLYMTGGDIVYFGAASAAAPLGINWSTSTTPTIISGTAATSLTVGTNKSAATLSLQVDAAATALQLAGGTQDGVALGSNIATVGHIRTPAGWVWMQRNAGNSGNTTVLANDTSNDLFIGGDTSDANTINSLYLHCGTSSFMDLISGGVSQWVFDPNALYGPAGSNSLIGFNQSVPTYLLQLAQASDVATHNFTIRAQYAFASASTHVVPGNLVFDIGAPISGNTHANFVFTENGVGSASNIVAQIGDSHFGEGHFWLGNTGSFTPSESNPALIANGTTYTYLNAPTTTGVIGLISGNSVIGAYLNFNINVLSIGNSSSTAAPIILNWLTSTTPFIQSGTSATQLTVGTNKSNAILVLAGGANISGWYFSSPTSTSTELQFNSPGLTNCGNIVANDNGAFAISANANQILMNVSSGIEYTSYSTSPHSFEDNGGVPYASITNGGIQILQGAGSTSYLQWAALAQAPLIYQLAATSDVAPKNMTLQPQGPFSGAVTHVDAGDVIVNIPASISGSTKYGGLVVEYNSIVQTRIGTYQDGADAGIWFLDGGSPSASNFAFLGNNTNTYMNSPSGSGNLFFGIGTSYLMTLTSSEFMLGSTTTSASQMYVDINNNSSFALHFGNVLVAPANIQYDAKTTDVATQALNIIGQGAWTSAVTNTTGGDVFVKAGAGTSASASVQGSIHLRVSPYTSGPNDTTHHGWINIEEGTTNLWRLGTWRSTQNLSVIWGLDGGSPSTTNWTLITDGTNTQLNAPSSGGAVTISCANNTPYPFVGTTTDARFGDPGGAATAAPVRINYTTTTTPIIQSGTSATQLTIGTNKASASLIFQTDAAVTTMQLTDNSPFYRLTIGPVTPSSLNFALEGDGTSTLAVNAVTTLEFLINGSEYMTLTSSALTLGFNTASPKIQSDSTSTSLTVGTNNSSGTLNLQGGAASTLISLATNAIAIGTLSSTTTYLGAVDGYVNLIGNADYTVDRGSKDEVIFASFSASHSIFLPVPTNGRELTIKDIGGNLSAAVTMSIVPHSTEKIEGIAATYVVSAPLTSIQLICDGTNWWIVN